MKKNLHKIFSILFISVFFVSDSKLFAQDKQDEETKSKSNIIYKHYTGTIGLEPIVLDLIFEFSGSSNFGGSYYYNPDSNGIFHFYILNPSREDRIMGILHGHNETEDTSLRVEDKPRDAIRWDFSIIDFELTGKWQNRMTGQTRDIHLFEYYKDSYAFEVEEYTDRVSERKNDSVNLVSGIFLVGVEPSSKMNKEDAAFINKECLHFLEGITMHSQGNELREFYTSYNRTYIEGTRLDLKKIIDENQPLSKVLLEYHSYLNSSVYFLPAYNDNGILVMRYSFRKSGGIEKTNYLCLDVQNKNRLFIADILKTDTARLSSLLEAELRKKYRLHPAEPLSTYLKTDKVPFNGNIMLTHKGINFCYNKGELTDEKELGIYISYEKLMRLLNKKFIRRMGLKD